MKQQKQSLRPADNFRFDTGRLCLDFVATMSERLSTEHWEKIPTAADLAIWLVKEQLCEGAPEISAAQHTQAQVLREAIYHSALAILAQSSPAASDVLLLNAQARHPIAIPQLDKDTGGVLWQAEQPFEAACSHIARDAIELFGSSDADLLGACEGRGCGMLFVNGSRSQHRRWCSMEECGNLHKVQAYRQRQKGLAT